MMFLQNRKENQLVKPLKTPENMDAVGQEALDDIA